MNDILKKEFDSGRDFKYVWGIFLDTFYRSDEDTRNVLIKDKPTIISDVRVMAFVASSVHKLAIDYNLTVPEWVFNDEVYLKEPFFANNPPSQMQLITLIESPPEFKSRNVFVSGNVLSRA